MMITLIHLAFETLKNGQDVFLALEALKVSKHFRSGLVYSVIALAKTKNIPLVIQ